jgi:starch synthase
MGKFNVVQVASEITPMAKTGGLADVVGTLGRELDKGGNRVWFFMPYYREVRQHSGIAVETVLKSLPVHLSPGMREEVAVLRGQMPGSKAVAYFIDHPRSFDRDHLYGTPDGDYVDNADRFTLFSRAVVHALKELKEPVDVVHCHDWQTALIPAYIKHLYAGDPLFDRTAVVYTIHNLAYQGIFSKDIMARTGLGWSFFTPDKLEFYGKVSFMKSGILYADRVTTVSPTYAKEILTPEHGFGLDGLLKTRSSDLSGVLNGIDTGEWDPAKDPHIATAYSRKATTGKEACRDALLTEMGYPAQKQPRPMVIGAVSRLAEQKGYDIVAEAIPRLAKKPVFIVILGYGDRHIQESLEAAARKHPDKVAVRMKFDNAMAHRVFAASDLFLMPSRFEPCGLGQMIALRYGSLPVARATGGLIDSITQVDSKKKSGTGFFFKAGTADALVKAVEEALVAHDDEALWKKVVAEAMGEDFSWETSAKKYESIYQAAKDRKK